MLFLRLFCGGGIGGSRVSQLRGMFRLNIHHN